jgi:hypothetical protein
MTRKAEDTLMATLEQGIRAVLKDKDASTSERLQAITAGAKLLAVRHKLEGGDEGGFFK